MVLRSNKFPCTFVFNIYCVPNIFYNNGRLQVGFNCWISSRDTCNMWFGSRKYTHNNFVN